MGVGPKGEIFLPFPTDQGRILPVSRFKSTWVTGSVSALRELGHFERYETMLSADARDAIVWAVPGGWLPTEIVLEHYRACEELALTEAELLALGARVTLRVQGTALAWGARAATDAGVSPWTLFGQFHRLWARVMDGGGVTIFKHGPKDASIQLIGFPLARYRYNRVATRGILAAMLGFFCSKVVVRELPSQRTAIGLTYLVQWV
jgi:hypothetical protein